VPEKLTLVVLLFIEPYAQTEFEEFEARAGSIMKGYGGAIERRIRISSPSPSEPQEVHVVTFPNRDAFERYCQAPELEAVADVRRKAIRNTIVWFGADCAPFLAS
jgi:hypothetical protein